jgi:glycosyltransferase involved in cell wall biosynthesis
VNTGVAEKKIVTVYNGLDLKRLQTLQTDRQEILRDLRLPLTPGMRFVTIVANLRSEVKNHRMFLRAAQRIRGHTEKVAFVLAGEGELTGALGELAGQLGIQEDVFFIGGCTKIAELLAVSEVCVLSSSSEGFSNSILEYMSAGKPVVATMVGGAAEAVIDGDTGFLVASNDDQAMAERILELLQDSEKAKRFGERGRRIVEEKFSLAAQLGKTLELYEGSSK